MASYWAEHGVVTIIWGIASAIFMALCVWSYIRARPVRPGGQDQAHPAPVTIELGPLPQALLPAPLYEEHHRDYSLPDNTEVEKLNDGYYYPRNCDFIGEPRR